MLDMGMVLLRAIGIIFGTLAVAGAADAGGVAADLLERHCVACHRADRHKGGLDLGTREALLRGGDSGAAVIPGKAADSLLYRRVAHLEDPGMPQKAAKLADADLAALAAWIDAGVPYPRALRYVPPAGAAAVAESASGERLVTDEDRKHWAFRPLLRPAVPAPRDGGWARTEVDRFILAGLQAKGLVPAAPADDQRLVRRLYFDLIGLPPTPEECAAALRDGAPGWYDRLVDTLLDDPRFGERWARHWLDLARYADSDGYEADGDRPGAWHYRDFVIRAIADDLPFDRFVQLQLAGDELAPGDPEALAATGFCAAGPRIVFTKGDEGTPQEREQIRYDQLDDVVTTTGAAMLGLTVGCARCHDHKYDALPTRDYYRLVATFATSRSEGRSFVKPKDKEGAPEVAAEVQRPFHLVDAQAMPAPAYLLGRGDPARKREPLGAGFLTVLSDDPGFARWLGAPKPAAPASTFQRAALARWMTDVEHGAGRLLARAIVNRLWQHHLGEGLARTPNDLGTQGERPTHPELLDWLASELVAGGWKLKPIHRLILRSAAYREGVAADAAKARVDGDDRLWWRRRPQRLEAEALRDAILAVGGKLSPERFGPPVKAWIPAEARTGRDKDFLPRPDRDGPEQWRRSIYLFVKRSLPLPFVDVFDAPAASASCGRRQTSTVATQALILLDDPFVRTQARLFAERVRAEAGPRPEDRIERAVRLALARAPDAAERDELLAFLRGDDARLVDLCHLLFTLDEFAYVD
jgi:mono/diheme cytochrome c family protein